MNKASYAIIKADGDDAEIADTAAALYEASSAIYQ